MGEVIRKEAATEEIIADTRDAMTRATARGGGWLAMATQALAAPLKLVDLVEARASAARATADPLIAVQQSTNLRVDDLVGRVGDSIWNDIGRPAHDPGYDLLFPGGIGFYTKASDEEQPVRMGLLAELVESGLHQALDAKKAKGYAIELRRAAAEFESAVDAARKPRAQAAMYDRMMRAAARNCQLGLVNYKRLLKTAGMSEADIHTVIRDRPTAKKSTAAPAPTPAPAPAPAPGPA